MKTRLWGMLALCLLMWPLGGIDAQDGTQGWPIVERCVGEAVEPSDEWSFPGAILLRNEAGLYALTAGVDEPLLIAVNDNWRSGALSPDGHWFATVQSERSYVDPWDVFEISAIQVYDTFEPGNVHVFPWNTILAMRWLSGIGTMWQERDVRWVDDRHLIYVQDGTIEQAGDIVMIDPLETEITDFVAPWPESDVNPLSIAPFFDPAPDWTRAIVMDYPGEDYFLYTVDSSEGLPLEVRPGTVSITWKPDSSQFSNLSNFYDEESFYGEISLFDRNGEFVEIMSFHRFGFEPVSGFLIAPWNGWSADGRYYAYAADQRDETAPEQVHAREHSIYIADLQGRRIIDTCISPQRRIHNVAWSPNSALFSFTSDGDLIQILDTEDWQLYTVAHHDGRIIGWRADE